MAPPASTSNLSGVLSDFWRKRPCQQADEQRVEQMNAERDQMHRTRRDIEDAQFSCVHGDHERAKEIVAPIAEIGRKRICIPQLSPWRSDGRTCANRLGRPRRSLPQCAGQYRKPIKAKMASAARSENDLCSLWDRGIGCTRKRDGEVRINEAGSRFTQIRRPLLGYGATAGPAMRDSTEPRAVSQPWPTVDNSSRASENLRGAIMGEISALHRKIPVKVRILIHSAGRTLYNQAGSGAAKF